MNLELKGKIIIVTGGAKGIGGAISCILAAEGAVPVIIDRSEKDNRVILESIKATGGEATSIAVELADPTKCKLAIAAVANQYERIDGLVNNAGVNDGVGLETGNYKGFLNSLHNNLIHYYMMTHYALPWLVKTKGSVVNIGSKVAETGQGGTSGYAAANGGRNALTREWAVELLKYSIRVNTVIVSECYTPLYESWIKTFENPEEKIKSITGRVPFQQRFTEATEIANTVTFLLSERSSHTTGQLIHVDGGYVHLDRAIK